MVSVRTNFGKTAAESAFFTGVDHEGNAPPANFYIILIKSTYNWAAADPDHHTVALIGAGNMILPTGNYTGNSVLRADASFTQVQNDTNNRSEITFNPAPVLSATSANVTDVKGWAICKENNLDATNRIYGLFDFTNPAFSVANGQPITINGAVIYIT